MEYSKNSTLLCKSAGDVWKNKYFTRKYVRVNPNLKKKVINYIIKTHANNEPAGKLKNKHNDEMEECPEIA